MPGTPCNSSNEVGKDLKPEDPQNVQRDEPTAPVREITQTDKLNKRLLVSFLQRMNSQEATDNQQSANKNDEDGDDEPTAPVHGITQTDKLNKRLLVSFLQRMNSQEATDNQQSANKNNEDDNDDESFE